MLAQVTVCKETYCRLQASSPKMLYKPFSFPKKASTAATSDPPMPNPPTQRKLRATIEDKHLVVPTTPENGSERKIPLSTMPPLPLFSFGASSKHPLVSPNTSVCGTQDSIASKHLSDSTQSHPMPDVVTYTHKSYFARVA